MKKTFKWNGKDLTVETTTYRSNGNIALMVYRKGHKDDYDIITVNIPDSMVSGSEEYVHLDTNNYPWAERFVMETGIGEDTGYRTQSGFCSYPLYFINLELFK